MKKELVLKREVKKLAGKFPYTSETEGWKGKSYYRFAYDEHVFTVHEDDDFIKAWENNKVHQVKLGITTEGASFLNFTTREDLISEARFDAEIEMIKLSASQFKRVENPEELV